MSYFRDNVERMVAYSPGEQPRGDQPVVKLNTNENPYPPSPRVAEAIVRELDDGAKRLRLYSDPAARQLREAAAQRFGFRVEQILHGNGSDELLSMLFRAVVEPGQTVAYPYPTYVLYETLAHAQGARILSFDFDDRFTLPAGLFGVDARLVLIASPNSPSGTAHDRSSLHRLADSLRRGVLVIDEAYAEFADDNALSLVREHDNVVVLRTFSKSHSLAGMRLGLLFGTEAIVTGLAKVKDSYNLDRLAIAAGAAALTDDEWTRRNVDRIRATRTRLIQRLCSLGLDTLPSQANFVLARFASAEQARAAFERLKAERVLVRYFGARLLDDALRISVGTDDEIDKLLEVLEGFLSARAG